MNKRTAISLFSGGGGLDLGMEAAGFSTRLSVDIDSYSVETLTLNKGKRPGPNAPSYLASSAPIQADVTNITGDVLLGSSGLAKGELDVLYGGPPCQAFSIFGKRMGTLDPRGNLIYEFARLVDETKPKAFVMENVPGLLTVENGIVYQNLLELLASRGPGYKITPILMNAADFGVPQYRQRVFLIGTSVGDPVPLPEPTHFNPNNRPSIVTGLMPHRSAGEALLSRPLRAPGENSSYANHTARRHSQRIVDRYTALKFGERDPVTRINKLDPDKPSYAIIVGSDSGGGKEHVHPFSPRALTQRESARMQTFPDWWVFAGKGRHVIRQVGNAVPPVLGARVGSHVATHVFGDAAELSYDDILIKLGVEYLGAEPPVQPGRALEEELVVPNAKAMQYSSTR